MILYKSYQINHANDIEQILNYCVDEEVILQQNAGAVLGKIIDLDKEVLYKHQRRMIDNLKLNPHDAVKRATMRVYQWLEIDEEVEGELFDIIINYLKDAEEPIAVKAFGMSAGRRICEKYPELANELLPYIEVLVDQKLSSGVVSRGEKELRLLRALI